MHTTKQRSEILKILEDNKDSQLSVDEIINSLSINDKKVGIATIYRTLDYYEQNGLIRKYTNNDNSKGCYQFIGENGECNNHYHLKCLSCGKLIHLNCETIENLSQHIESEHGFIIDKTKTLLYGKCKECIAVNDKENK